MAADPDDVHIPASGRYIFVALDSGLSMAADPDNVHIPASVRYIIVALAQCCSCRLFFCHLLALIVVLFQNCIPL